MQNKEAIISFVLGFGKDITIMEPDWLKKELVDIITKIKEKY